MFFVLSKTVYHLLMPSGLILILLLLAIWKVKWRKRALWGALILFLVFTNSWLANQALRWWEVPPQTYEETNTYAVGVVLSGMRNVNKSPRNRVHFAASSDRLWQTIFLYRRGKIKHILLTGADYIDWKGDVDTTRTQLRDALIDCGIPPQAITFEPLATNTAENAAYTAELLRKKFPDAGKVLLITSAFHMRRSAACFRKQGVAFDTFSTDFRSGDSDYIRPAHLFPSPQALAHFELIGKEIIGMLVYRLRGEL